MESDLDNMGVQKWREAAMIRKQWKQVALAAKAHIYINKWLNLSAF